jgi:hypothetical protein
VTDFRRDAALAACCGALLLALLAVTGGLGELSNPAAMAVGVFGAVAVEAAFLADTPVADWWTRPWARVVSAVVFLGSTLGTALVVGPLVVAAACWGLATYFAFLALAVSGYWP